MLLLAIAIGYIACSSNALYQDIDSFVAQEKSLGYYLQLIAAGYLFLLTGLSCFAAYYDQKYIIRAVSFRKTSSASVLCMFINYNNIKILY